MSVASAKRRLPWVLRYTISKDIDAAVLMRGDGTRYLEPRPMPGTEAVALWMVPGLYRLPYAMIEPFVTV
jgi:hypothetical protein